jgi:hypothetical protein
VGGTGQQRMYIDLSLQHQALLRKQHSSTSVLEAKDVLRESLRESKQWQCTERVKLQAELSVLVVEQQVALIMSVLQQATSNEARQHDSSSELVSLDVANAKKLYQECAALRQMIDGIEMMQRTFAQLLCCPTLDDQSSDGERAHEAHVRTDAIFVLFHTLHAWCDNDILQDNRGMLAQVRKTLQNKVTVISVCDE